MASGIRVVGFRVRVRVRVTRYRRHQGYRNPNPNLLAARDGISNHRSSCKIVGTLAFWHLGGTLSSGRASPGDTEGF